VTITLAVLETASLLAVVCGMLAFGSQGVAPELLDVGAIAMQAVGLSLCFIVAFYFNDLYDLRIVRTLGEFAPRLVQAIGIALLMVTVLEVIVRRGQPPQVPMLSILFAVVTLVVGLRAVSYGLMRSRPFVERALIIGASPLTCKLIDEIEGQPHRRYRVVGVADDASATAAQLPPRYPLLGPLNHLEKIIDDVRPSRIIVGLSERRGRLPVRQLLESRVRGIPVEDGVRVYERLTGKLAIESLAPSVLVFSEDFRKSRLDLALGRILSPLVALVGLIVSAPLFLAVAVAIKLTSPGPVFFVQERVGLHGRRFKLIKFRTMRPVDQAASEWERDNSDRITAVGRWLRKFRLDELPQFVNMLRGEMNLVGPRPHPVSNYELFRENIPYYTLRCLVPPGLTGWAQVRYGYANGLEEETEKMRYDLFYIKHLSFELDLRILVETVKIVLFGRESR
jgi:exopolysaccharide biosynthesis polyprenyl glycosylphosphotransferase